MFKFFQKNTSPNDIKQLIIVKSEIDYDKLADKIVQSMENYQEKHALTTETIITNALNNYESQKEDKENSEAKIGTLLGMRVLIFFAYFIAALALFSFGISFCSENSVNNSFDSALALPFVFWGASGILITFGISALIAKKKNEIERHFLILTTMISLLLATLALFITNDNSNNSKVSNNEPTSISEEYDKNQT